MANKLDVYFPLIIGDWLKGTRGMRANVKGVYIGLLLYQWDNGYLPESLDELAFIEPEVGSVWVSISDKFPVVSAGRRQNLKCEEVRDFFEKQRKNGSKGGRPKKQNPNNNPNVNPNNNPNTNPPFELELGIDIQLENKKESDQIFPSDVLASDELYSENLQRQSKALQVDLQKCLDDWDGWYCSKFTGWRHDYDVGKLTTQDLRKSFESWMKDPRSKKIPAKNGLKISSDELERRKLEARKL